MGGSALAWDTVPNPPRAIVGPLSTLCDPYLGLFRGILPNLGGLDFSPILAFVTLNFLTSSAVALPAEMPEYNEDGSLKNLPKRQPTLRSRFEELWAKRLEGAKAAAQQ